jgi:type IV secretory pathway TrbD component
MKKAVALFLVLTMFCGPVGVAFAEPSDAAGWHSFSSALVPGLGQILNGQHRSWWGGIKTFTMFAVELGAIITTPILAAGSGWPIVMVGAGMFLVNHTWSAWDAYRNGPQIEEVYMEGTDIR